MGDYVEDILDNNDLEIELLEMLDDDMDYDSKELVELFSNPDLIAEYHN